MKFCRLVESDITQNRVGRNFEFPPLKKLAPLYILRLHYGQWDEKFQIYFTQVSKIVLGRYFQAYQAGGVKAYFESFHCGKFL